MASIPALALAALLLLGTSAGAQDRPEPAAKDATVFSFKLHYLEAGRGQPVILLHGFPYDIHSYLDVVPPLAAAGHRVIVPYLRGFGTTRFLSDKTVRNGEQAAIDGYEIAGRRFA